MSPAAAPAVVLWPDGPPGGAPARSPEATSHGSGDAVVRNVSVPTLTPFLPDAGCATGSAVVVAPGGGFRTLSWGYEGTAVAQWLAERGIAAFVLKYRLLEMGATDHDFQQAVRSWIGEVTARGLGPLSSGGIAPEVEGLAADDGRQTVRLVRSRAAEWEVHPDRVGLLGFSAGAFLAVEAAVGEDPTGRPDFLGAVYGGRPSVVVPAGAPPLFTVVAADDPLCLDGCLETFSAWRTAGRSAELHVYDRGGHGFGARLQGLPSDAWPERWLDWLTVQGLHPRSPVTASAAPPAPDR